ncbi:MAG: helix-turn-helix transcriptional regulator [candidate division WOR-3 bacterium]
MIEYGERYKELVKGFEKDPEYWVEYLKLVFSEEIGRLMDQRKMSRAELARKLGVSRAYITRLFRGTFNPTLETLVKIALALDARVSIHLHSGHTEARWVDISFAEPDPHAERWLDRHSTNIALTSKGRLNAFAPVAS